MLPQIVGGQSRALPARRWGVDLARGATAEVLTWTWPRIAPYRPFVVLALAFGVYLLPALAGYAWDANNPDTPLQPGIQTTRGRASDISTSVERYGTGVVYVPFEARLRRYLESGELPLWNPDQGLGEPFAAQGDGNPYFPFQIVRSLVGYASANYVTFFEYYGAAVAMYLFLRGLELSEWSAVAGSLGYALSGALTLHIARPNIGDQLCMLPVLFWAAARAIRSQTIPAYVVFAITAGLHLLGGFVQIAMIDAVVVAIFILAYARSIYADPLTWVRCSATSLVIFVLGNGLGAFYLLPQLESARITFNKNTELLAFLPMPDANILAFFSPLLFGNLFASWLPGGYPNGVDWNNLYAYAGDALLILPLVGWVATRGLDGRHRFAVVFFSLAAILLLLRFMSFPPASGMGVLPALGRQSPKHALGPAVFCLAVAAAVGVERIRFGRAGQVRWVVCVALAAGASWLLTAVGRRGGWGAMDAENARFYGSISLFLLVVLMGVFWAARRARGLSSDQARILLLSAVVGELGVYVPLGNSSREFLYARLAVFVLCLLAGAAWALQWRRLTVLPLAAAVVGYAALVVLPPVGLPRRSDLDAPAPFMRWLEQQEGGLYRSFGIVPDYSSTAGLQDISTVGPLAPKEFEHFVDVVSSTDEHVFYDSSSTFSLTTGPEQPYNLSKDYPRARPVFDWMGVRYLVLNRGVFFDTPPGRKDDRALLAAEPNLRVPYEDGTVRIVESTTAWAKAFFWPGAEVYPDQASILAKLKAEPRTILGTPKVERDSVARLQTPQSPPGAKPVPVEITSYRPNSVRMLVDAPSAGIAVLTDSYFPGWRARLDASPADVLRVNGLARGVLIPVAGRHVVEFEYAPDSFIDGVRLSGGIGVFLAGLLVYARLRRRPR